MGEKGPVRSVQLEVYVMSGWPVLRLSFSKEKLLSQPLGTPHFGERSPPGKIKFGLIFIQIDFFLSYNS